MGMLVQTTGSFAEWQIQDLGIRNLEDVRRIGGSWAAGVRPKEKIGDREAAWRQTLENIATIRYK